METAQALVEAYLPLIQVVAFGAAWSTAMVTGLFIASLK